MLHEYNLSSYEREFVRLITYLYFIYKGYGRLPVREGWNVWGIGDHHYPLFCEPNRLEYVIEHEPSCVFFAFLLFEFFPQYFYGIKREEVYELLLTHDTGEAVIGDIPDDKSRDEEKKDREELAFFEWLFDRKALDRREIPGFKRLLKNFKDFQKKSTILARFAYCIDKTDALLQGLVYEYSGFPGNVIYKKAYSKLSNQDKKALEITGSSKIVDNWFESGRENVERADPTGAVKFFTLFTEEAIAYVRSDDFTLREDLNQYCKERGLPIPSYLKNQPQLPRH